MDEMNEKKEYPKRKPTRLKQFDYSSVGAYFVTICVNDRKRILSEIVKINPIATDEMTDSAVGEGLAPPEFLVMLKPCGIVVEEQLQLIEKRFENVTIEDFVIMPDHIHVIIFLHEKAGGASPSPTLNDVVCALKSLISRNCKKQYGIEKVFQRSFAEHIIRDQKDYETRRKYIWENPMKWYYKQLETKK